MEFIAILTQNAGCSADRSGREWTRPLKGELIPFPTGLQNPIICMQKLLELDPRLLLMHAIFMFETSRHPIFISSFV